MQSPHHAIGPRRHDRVVDPGRSDREDTFDLQTAKRIDPVTPLLESTERHDLFDARKVFFGRHPPVFPQLRLVLPELDSGRRRITTLVKADRNALRGFTKTPPALRIRPERNQNALARQLELQSFAARGHPGALPACALEIVAEQRHEL